MPSRLKPRQAVLEQQQEGYILKWLTEEQFWKYGRYVFFKTLREVNEQAKRKGVGR